MNSTQLELKLNDVRLRIPWNGMAPRDLTRGGSRRILTAQAAKERSCLRDSRQLEMFEPIECLPAKGGGAPLLSLPRRTHAQRSEEIW